MCGILSCFCLHNGRFFASSLCLSQETCSAEDFFPNALIPSPPRNLHWEARRMHPVFSKPQGVALKNVVGTPAPLSLPLDSVSPGAMIAFVYLSLSPSLSLSKHFVVGVLPPSFRELPAPQSLPNTNTHTHASYLDHCHSQHIYLVVVWCFLLDSQGTSNTSTPYRRCSLSFAPQETHQMTRYVQCMLIACLIHSCKALKQSNGQVGCCR